MQAPKKPQPGRSLCILKVNIPAVTVDWLRDRAAREGVTLQSLVAPVLNAFARGEILGGFSVVPDPHGNAGRRS